MLEQASVLKGPRSAWPAKLQSDMNCTFGSPGALVEPMALAIRRADPTVFAQAATAIKVLRLPGHRDDLEGDMLADYFRDPAKEKEPGSKKAGGAGASRWAGRALVDVAVLVKKSYRDLRKAMGGVLDEQPSVADELATYRAELAAATTECEWLRKSLKQAKNAHQMSAKRLKAKHCAVTEARQDERRKAQEALKVAKAALKVAAAEKLAAARAELAAELESGKEYLDAHYGYVYEEQRVAVNTARERARKAEAETRKAEGQVQKLQKQMDEMMAESEEDSDE